MKVFKRFGRVRAAYSIKDLEGNSKTYGYVDFHDEKSARKALACKPIYIEGKAVDVKPYKKKAKVVKAPHGESSGPGDDRFGFQEMYRPHPAGQGTSYGESEFFGGYSGTGGMVPGGNLFGGMVVDHQIQLCFERMFMEYMRVSGYGFNPQQASGQKSSLGGEGRNQTSNPAIRASFGQQGGNLLGQGSNQREEQEGFLHSGLTPASGGSGAKVVQGCKEGSVLGQNNQLGAPMLDGGEIKDVINSKQEGDNHVEASVLAKPPQEFTRFRFGSLSKDFKHPQRQGEPDLSTISTNRIGQLYPSAGHLSERKRVNSFGLLSNIPMSGGADGFLTRIPRPTQDYSMRQMGPLVGYSGIESSKSTKEYTFFNKISQQTISPTRATKNQALGANLDLGNHSLGGMYQEDLDADPGETGGGNQPTNPRKSSSFSLFGGFSINRKPQGGGSGTNVNQARLADQAGPSEMLEKKSRFLRCPIQFGRLEDDRSMMDQILNKAAHINKMRRANAEVEAKAYTEAWDAAIKGEETGSVNKLLNMQYRVNVKSEPETETEEAKKTASEDLEVNNANEVSMKPLQRKNTPHSDSTSANAESKTEGTIESPTLAVKFSAGDVGERKSGAAPKPAQKKKRRRRRRRRCKRKGRQENENER